MDSAVLPHQLVATISNVYKEQQAEASCDKAAQETDTCAAQGVGPTPMDQRSKGVTPEGSGTLPNSAATERSEFSRLLSSAMNR